MDKNADNMKKNDEFLKIFFRNDELVQLTKDILADTGMTDEEPDWKPDWSKVVYPVDCQPGARVEIHWVKNRELEPDKGYIFTLPGWDSRDIFMSGIVHIPRPNGCEKCDCDPEWHLLSKLASDRFIEKIIIESII